MTPLTNSEVVKQQTCLIGKLEDAIRQHERACIEKQLLEENVTTKEEENRKLKSELDSLKQNKTTDTAMNENLIASTESRISACENEMTDLRRRIEELESIIEEQSMQVKRGTCELGTGVVNILGQFSMLAQQKIEKQEADYLATLKEKEKDLIAAQEEGKEKEQRSLEILKEKDTELQQLQKREDELHRRIQELEHKNALQEKEKALLVAQEKGKEKEQRSLEVLTEKDAELQLLQKQKTEDELHRRIQQLEHKNALQEKEMRIKELELQNLMSRQKEEFNSEERKPTLRTRDLDSGASKQKRGLFDWFRPRRDNIEEPQSHNRTEESDAHFLQAQDYYAVQAESDAGSNAPLNYYDTSHMQVEDQW